MVERHDPKIAMINDLTHMFTSDPQVDEREGKRLVVEIMNALGRIPKDVFVAVSMRRPIPEYQKIVIPACSKHG